MNIPALDDSTYRATVGRAAFRLAGAGFEPQKIADLDSKLQLARAMLSLSSKAWPDQILSYLLFGDQPGVSPPEFNRKKLGKAKLSAEDAAALAQLLNYFALGLGGEGGAYSAAAAREATAFICSSDPGNAGLRAVDLLLPMLPFAGRLAAATAGADETWRDILHDRIVSHLNGLRAASDSCIGAVIGEVRDRHAPKKRFGRLQAPPEQPPADWEPLLLRPGERIEVGLPLAVPDRSCELTALTVRDPRPPAAGTRRGPYAWDTPWAELVRWTAPAVLPPGAPLSVPLGEVVPLDGLYRTYLLLHRGGDGSVGGLLGESGGSGVDSFHALIEVARKGPPLPFECYTRAYRVRVKP